MSTLSESVSVITGAAGALGSVVAGKFRESGAQLALIDRDRKSLLDRWGEREGVICRECDLTDAEEVDAAVKEILEHFGKIDSLLNIAGAFAMGPPVHEMTTETWDTLQESNLRSVFLMSRAVIPHMRERKSGRIVNIAAKTALHGAAFLAPYIISKSSVIRLTECLADENRREGIRVNCLLPEVIDTPANRKEMPKADFSSWAAPEAIADLLVFLASDASRAVNGASIPVCGSG